MENLFWIACSFRLVTLEARAAGDHTLQETWYVERFPNTLESSNKLGTSGIDTKKCLIFILFLKISKFHRATVKFDTRRLLINNNYSCNSSEICRLLFCYRCRVWNLSNNQFTWLRYSTLQRNVTPPLPLKCYFRSNLLILTQWSSWHESSWVGQPAPDCFASDKSAAYMYCVYFYIAQQSKPSSEVYPIRQIN